MTTTHTQYFPVRHALYPDGHVTVTTLNEAGQVVSTDEYTLEQWAAL